MYYSFMVLNNCMTYSDQYFRHSGAHTTYFLTGPDPTKICGKTKSCGCIKQRLDKKKVKKRSVKTCVSERIHSLKRHISEIYLTVL